MRSGKLPFLILLSFVLVLSGNCGGGGGGGGGDSGGGGGGSPPAPDIRVAGLVNGASLAPVTGDNVVTLTINGSTCSALTSANYPNKPCVSVTLCDSSSGNCQAINDVLLDTGDNGLRIFQQTLNAGLLAALSAAPVRVSGSDLYECVEYGDGSTVWGPVRQGKVILGNVTTSTTNIQVTGSSDGNPAVVCRGAPRLDSPGAGANQGHYNGTLGVGILAQDCGSACVSRIVGLYYTCPGGVCSGVTVPVAGQVQNPVANLPLDNNGVIVSLPSVPPTGSLSVSGYLILGIGTRANNNASGVYAHGVASNGRFTTAFNSTSYSSFLDTGSNGLFFPNYGIATTSGWYTPPSTLSLSAITTGAANAANQSRINFDVANAAALFGTGNYVFSNLGGAVSSSLFDWGLPFFLGRNVYVGIEGRASPGLAVGPFWAY